MQTRTQLTRPGLFDARVPRYTSYPTAPHFADTIGPDSFVRWVQAVPNGAKISLYVHIPFCRRLCWFCACRTQGTKTDAPVSAYLEVLKAELRMLARLLPDGVTLGRLHWGGGTPTLLGPEMIRELAGAIFDVAPMAGDGEFSVEVDPNEIGPRRMDALARAGMTRATIGVQDFAPDIQEAIGRVQGYDSTRDAVEMIRARGINDLNADILFGLPHQDRASITESVQLLLSLSPDRVALNGYAHVPSVAKRQQLIPSGALPTPEERLDLFETARRLLAWDGYDEVGIDHFALPSDSLARAARAGGLRRDFQGYTDDPSDALIGVGASAISRFPQGFAQNAPATSAHQKAIREGRFSTARGHALTGEDRWRGRAIEMLLCDFAIDRARLMAETGVSAAEVDQAFAKLARACGAAVRLTGRGLEIAGDSRPLARSIARELDAYDLSAAGHISAI